MSFVSVLTTDFDSHRIEGFTREGGHQFSVPLFSPIDENLWMGGCPRGEAPPQFDTIICLYTHEPYSLHQNQVHLSVDMRDGPMVPDVAMLEMLADTVNRARERGTVLVHCQAGLNRSGLITALALIRSSKYAPDAAIAHLRERRCDAVLCNAAFAKWLMDQAQPKTLEDDFE